MDSTTIIAWIGVITGSIGTITGVSALVWDYYKWKSSGPKLQVEVIPGMAMHTPQLPLTNERLLWIRVVNSGTAKTTLTTLSFSFFPAEPNKKLTKPNATEHFLVTHPMPGRLPHVLEPGEQWDGFANQDNHLEELARTGYLYAQVYHSMGLGTRHPQELRSPMSS